VCVTSDSDARVRADAELARRAANATSARTRHAGCASLDSDTAAERAGDAGKRKPGTRWRLRDGRDERRSGRGILRQRATSDAGGHGWAMDLSRLRASPPDRFEPLRDLRMAAFARPVDRRPVELRLDDPHVRTAG
jgi:hypothetical protein